MIEIKNKIDSLKYIHKLGLNNFYEKVFTKYQEKEIIDFMDKNPVKYYILRDKIKSGAKVYFNITRQEVLNHYKEYALFSLDVASYNYRDNKILTGDILISRDNNFTITASSNKECDLRSFPEPSYIFSSDIFDKRIKHIPGSNKIIDYIYKHELFDIIVEFCVFDIPLGINNEYVIIYELRTHY